MSMDSDTSSQGGDHRSFRQITRDRLLFEMLRSTRKHSKSTWKILQKKGFHEAKDSSRRIGMFLNDMSGRNPLYKNSPIQKELVTQIKKDSSVLPRIGALSEMNLEYFAIDSQGFTTDHERALEELFSENALDSHKYNACLNTMATRISTVFASMREFPRVHYRVAKTIDASVTTTLRDLVPTKLAAAVWNCLSKLKTSIPDYPQTETCELLIVDRSVDQIAPIIHEWTYDAMCHDLLCMDGNKYVHEVPSKNGSSTEKKDVLLEDHDPIWVELRHAHIADASERLHDKMSNFVSKNKAAQLQQARTGGEISNRDLQKMVQALPQYSDQIEKLSLHVEGGDFLRGKNQREIREIGKRREKPEGERRGRAEVKNLEGGEKTGGRQRRREEGVPGGGRRISKLNSIIREQGLRDVGQLEQDLGVSRENKLRLLMIYAAINPEKFESDKGEKLMQKKHGLRKERTGEESTWALSRFYPVLEDLIEKLSKGELPKDEYYCMNDPSPSFHGLPMSSSVRTSPAHQPAHSMRSRRTGGTWARPRGSDDGYSSDSVLKHSSSDFKKLGQRIFVFVIGGATRSELRAVHKLTSKLKREVILGSSSLDDPPQFITKLKMMSVDELTLDDLQI
uniref:SNARE-interacting protein KEULE n=1 Tax=Oryza glumipatula TaxID=40148 RepID=A0A0D9YRT4_9ORYZ